VVRFGRDDRPRGSGRALAARLSARAATRRLARGRLYQAQLAEIDRDVERGQLPRAEAAAARAEAARRLIAASAAEPAVRRAATICDVAASPPC